jgi:RNA polymerase sigma-70 factor (ECF subfamily)
LVAAARQGDRGALERLLSRHYDPVFAVCRRLTGNEADAADATQEALIAIVRGLPRFDGRSRFSTWIYRVAVNASLDELRRRKRRPEPLESLATAAVVGEATAAIDQRLDVDAALRALAPEFRAAVVLRDLCGLDYAEIGDILQVPAGTVRSRIARGRANLAPLLGNPDPAADRPTMP